MRCSTIDHPVFDEVEGEANGTATIAAASANEASSDEASSDEGVILGDVTNVWRSPEMRQDESARIRGGAQTESGDL